MASSLEAILQKLEMDTSLSFFSEYTPPEQYQKLPVVLYTSTSPTEDSTYGGGSGIYRYSVQFRIVSTAQLQVVSAYNAIATSINNYCSGEPGWITTQSETSPVVWDDSLQLYVGYATYNVMSNLPENQADLVQGLISSSAQFGGDDDFIMGNLEVEGSSNLGDTVVRSLIVDNNFFISGTLFVPVISASQISGQFSGTIATASHAMVAEVLIGSVESASFAHTASLARTSSLALVAITASYASNVPPTASWSVRSIDADTASFVAVAKTSISSSFATNAKTSETASTLSGGLDIEWSVNASSSLFASASVSSSYSEASLTASFAVTASHVLGIPPTSSWAQNAVQALTASYVDYSNVVNKPTLISSSAQLQDLRTGSFTGSFVGTASYSNDAGTSVSASYSLSGSFALTASYLAGGVPPGTSSYFDGSKVTIDTTPKAYVENIANYTATQSLHFKSSSMFYAEATGSTRIVLDGIEAGRTVNLMIFMSGSVVATFPLQVPNVVWMGGTIPTVLFGNRQHLLSFTAFGNDATKVIGAFSFTP